MTKNKINIAIFVSGRGSNLEAIIKATKDKDYPAKISLVFCDKLDAPAIEISKKHLLPTIVLEKLPSENNIDFDKKIYGYLNQFSVELIVLAGYMKIISKFLIDKFANRILNIHPSLLPLYRGKNAVYKALQHNPKIIGCTIHLVNEKIDDGPIIAQSSLLISAHKAPNKLADTLRQQEHCLYPTTIAQYIKNYI